MTRWAPLTIAALILVGCAHYPEGLSDGLSSNERQQRLAAIADWDIRGRLGIETGERSYNASVDWSQRGEQLKLEVRGALGARSFRVSGDAERLTVEASGETRTLTDPEVELSAEFGWWLPVTSLEYWLLGRPDPDYPRRLDRGAEGTLAMLEQRDWRIVYERYQLIDGLLIPDLITMSHSTLGLTLKIRNWEPAGA